MGQFKTYCKFLKIKFYSDMYLPIIILQQVGTVISKDSEIYMINVPGRDLEAIQRLGRIGYKVLIYLQ